MDTQQARNLRKLCAALLRLPSAKAAKFDIRSREHCAWGFAHACGLIPGFTHNFDNSHEIFGVLREYEFDDKFSEEDYLFQNTPLNSWPYDAPTGRKGIEEFADRVENILQYHRSIA